MWSFGSREINEEKMKNFLKFFFSTKNRTNTHGTFFFLYFNFPLTLFALMINLFKFAIRIRQSFSTECYLIEEKIVHIMEMKSSLQIVFYEGFLSRSISLSRSAFIQKKNFFPQFLSILFLSSECLEFHEK